MDDGRREQLMVEILGLERSYRALARLTPDEDRRIELVDMANAIRPRTLT
jgi:serine/threonine-protein kinase PknG